ncbi:UNVERIFIED_CONTAM: hypothetical protein RMT77_007674 [Armadillidium vulgare]
MTNLKDTNPFCNLLSKILIEGKYYKYFDLTKLNDVQYERLPFSIRVLLESAIRNCDNFQVSFEDVSKILEWEKNQNDPSGVEVPFKPARVILQDFTGVPAVVDFAAMRDTVKELGGDPAKINPICPADLVIDHSVQVDFSRSRLHDMKERKVMKSRCGDCKSTESCRWHKNPHYRRGSPHLGYHRFRHRPQSQHMFASRPNSPISTTRAPKPMEMIYHTPHSYVSYPICHIDESTVGPFIPFIQTPVSFVPSVVGTISTSVDNTSYYTGDPFVVLPSSSSKATFPQQQQHILPDMEDIAAIPQDENRSHYQRYSVKNEPKKSTEDDGQITPPPPPPLRIPVSTLPCPQDAPGIPLQDSVCPFHQLSSAWSDALSKNEEIEFERNKERFIFLKWGSQTLKNMLIVPPGSGIVHQVNLEYLARVVFDNDGILYPDSLVGTDSHTTMINGLGVLGWGVGGIEAEAVMLGQSISMVLPQVVGYKITGKLSPLATSTDVVLTITKHLRQIGVIGKFVEFFGEGVVQLSLADRATVSNMCPEYGATVGFFPVDEATLAYLRQSNRSEEKIQMIEAYLKTVKMFRNYLDPSEDPVYSQVVELDLSTVVPSVSGPKRPHDKVCVSNMKDDFRQCLSNKVGFKGFEIPAEYIDKKINFSFEGKEYTLKHGSVVIAAVTSCTNTSNPSVMLGAGILAKNAVNAGLSVSPYIKTSLSPGSGVVTHYLQHSGVTPYLQQLGFDIVGYGCMTCIGNSGPLPDAVAEAIEKGDLVCCGVLSGNRNFEGRIHPLTRANYLASPLLVIAYAIAGTIDIDFELEPLGTTLDGKEVYLRDIWPSRQDIQEIERISVLPNMFAEVYKSVTSGNENWNLLNAPKGMLYPWDSSSTYIKKPPFFDGMTKEIPPIKSIENAYVLLNLGDSVTTDHISPAGSIARNSPAARYLAERGLTPREFNSYGSRRGNDAVMVRGTFANIRLVNKFIGKASPRTIYIPSGEEMDIFDAAERYRNEGKPVIILAGKEYGSGSSRDWAAKGPFLLGVRAVIAESYERIHRSNLVGMGIIPLQFLDGQNSEMITGKETFTIDLPEKLEPKMKISVKVSDGKTFEVLLRFDTEVELTYFYHGGILNYMIRKMVQ